jgi:hypothetical protein
VHVVFSRTPLTSNLTEHITSWLMPKESAFLHRFIECIAAVVAQRKQLITQHSEFAASSEALDAYIDQQKAALMLLVQAHDFQENNWDWERRRSADGLTPRQLAERLELTGIWNALCARFDRNSLKI